FDSSGQALGGEIFVNGFSAGAQDDPSIAIDGNGGFVVVWTSNGQDGALLGVFGRRFSAVGLRLGVEFQVPVFTVNNQSGLSIAMRPNGDFVVAWSSLGQDGSDLGVFASRYSSTGTALGAELQVNAYTTGIQTAPALVLDAK